MNAERSRQSAKHDAYNCDVNPRDGAVVSTFIIANQPPVLHEPRKRALHDPPPRQHGESLHVLSAFYHFDFELGPMFPRSLGKFRASIAAVDPELPEPPQPENEYPTDNTSYLEMQIAAYYLDVYMMVTAIPGRAEWVPNLKEVEQDKPDVFVGSVHRCTFENYHAVLSPMRMTVSDEGVLYAESCRIDEMKLTLVYEYVFRNIGDKTSIFSCRFMNANESQLPEETTTVLFGNLRMMAEKLKEHCEKTYLEGIKV